MLNCLFQYNVIVLNLSELDVSCFKHQETIGLEFRIFCWQLPKKNKCQYTISLCVGLLLDKCLQHLLVTTFISKAYSLTKCGKTR